MDINTIEYSVEHFRTFFKTLYFETSFKETEKPRQNGWSYDAYNSAGYSRHETCTGPVQ